MNTYKITYERNGRSICVVRKADSAQAAAEALCDQYGWGYRLKQYDGDTRGCHWAECSASTDGSNSNWDIALHSEKGDVTKVYSVSYDYLIDGKYHPVHKFVAASTAKDACQRVRDTHEAKMQEWIARGYSRLQAKRRTHHPFHIEATRYYT